MKKVFLVTDGSYSNFHVEAVFSTKHLANKYIKANTDNQGKEEDSEDFIGQELRVYEFILDQTIYPTRFRREWEQQINLHTGEIGKYAGTISYKGYTPADKSRVVVADNQNKRAGKTKIDEETSEFQSFPTAKVISYVSAEHADKLAVEARQKWLREGNWMNKR